MAGAVSVQKPPSECTPLDASTKCSASFVKDGAVSSLGGGSGKTGSGTAYYKKFGFSIPEGAVVNKVEAAADAFSIPLAGKLVVSASRDGGASFGPKHEVPVQTSKKTVYADLSKDFSWIEESLRDSALQLKLECVSGGPGGHCSVDFIQVKIDYVIAGSRSSLNPTGFFTASPSPGLVGVLLLAVLLLAGYSVAMDGGKK